MKQPINIIFDGPPSHNSGRFVEVETDSGKSIHKGIVVKLLYLEKIQKNT